MDGMAKLISETFKSDPIGVRKPTETARDIIVFAKSISRSEWSAAARQGLRTAAVLTTAAVNYNDEKIVEYNGKRYGIYRTYLVGDDIELYLEEKGGI